MKHFQFSPVPVGTGQAIFHFPFQLGFTLVELMVVVVISALLVSGGLAAYSRYNERQLVVNAGKRLYNDIRFIQGKAAAGEKPEECQEDGVYEGTLEGYQLLVDSDSEHYTLGAICVTADDGEQVVIDLRTETLVRGVMVVADDNGTLFRVLSQGGEAEQFCLTGYDDYIYRVWVSALGEVSDDGLVDACP